MMKKKVITIEVTDEEVDALEKIFFVKMTEEDRRRLDDAKHSLWKKIATAFDYEKENKPLHSSTPLPSPEVNRTPKESVKIDT